LAALTGGWVGLDAAAGPLRTPAARPVGQIELEPALTVIREAQYQLVVSSGDGELTVETPSGRVFTRFPLVALAGRTALP
jgi:hypothetical protein